MKRSKLAIIVVLFSGMFVCLQAWAGTRSYASESSIIRGVPYVCQKERLD